MMMHLKHLNRLKQNLLAMSKFEYYLHDLAIFIKENALAAKRDLDLDATPEDRAYRNGYLMAYHEVVDLMKQQARLFDIKNYWPV